MNNSRKSRETWTVAALRGHNPILAALSHFELPAKWSHSMLRRVPCVGSTFEVHAADDIVYVKFAVA